MQKSKLFVIVGGSVMTNIELMNAIISKVENRAKINDEFESSSKGTSLELYYVGTGDALSLVLNDLKKMKEDII